MIRTVVLAVIALAACAPGADGPGRDRPLSANPSAVIAAELAFARLAQDKGQWTAFRATATDDAEMFAPQRVNAHQFLKDKPDPPVSVAWQPAQVWSSCDGSVGVTKGPWQRPGGVGFFTTVWRRQQGGGYKWVLDQGEALTAPLPVGEMIAAKVADCAPGAGPVPAAPPEPGVDAKLGSSADGTLQWSSEVWPDGRRRFTVWLWNGTSFDAVLNDSFAAPAG